MKHLLYLIVGMLGLVSCGKSDIDPQKQLDKDIKIIEDYLQKNNLTAEKTVHGIYYIIEKEGGVEKPKVTNSVKVNYKGYTTDGVEFDSATNATFPLSNVIQGWQIGIPKFGIDGKGKLLIPSKYGYGTSKNVLNRANVVLIFDIELVDIL